MPAPARAALIALADDNRHFVQLPTSDDPRAYARPHTLTTERAHQIIHMTNRVIRKTDQCIAEEKPALLCGAAWLD